MNNKIKRLSFNQLRVLKVFLVSGDKILTVGELERKADIKGKSLGGVLSALSRNQFRGLSLIEPVGGPKEGSGLRWQLNQKSLDIKQAKLTVEQLLKTYD